MLIPYLWHPKESLEKIPCKSWKRLKIRYRCESEEETISYLKEKFINDKTGKLKQIISYNNLGQEVSYMDMFYPDEHTEITKHRSGRHGTMQDIKRFNEKGFLIEHPEETFGGGVDETKYFYDENSRLQEIVKKDEDGDIFHEKYIYEKDRLHKIETSNSDGDSLFRGFIYNEAGQKERLIRMQNGTVKSEVNYFYNPKGQLIREINESINRFKGGKNTLMTTEYTYHENGKLKSEIFMGMDSYKGKNKFESHEIYNEQGLMVSNKEIDYEEEKEEIYLYEYELLKP